MDQSLASSLYRVVSLASINGMAILAEQPAEGASTRYCNETDVYELKAVATSFASNSIVSGSPERS